MSRKLSEGIIPAFVKFCEETEIPSLYALWCGISAVGATLGRRCSLAFGYKTVFPNLFVILVAESGTCRKSSGIVLANEILADVRPAVNLLSQKMTPEALIDALCTNKVADDKIIIQAEGIAVADEVTTLIDKNAIKTGLTNLMTNLYDCGDFSYRTRGRGVETIKNPCFSMLGGTTAYWIKEALSTSSIVGGFTARIVFVYLEDRERNIAWPDISVENITRKANITHDLCEVAKLNGPFSISKRAKDAFVDEYEGFNKESALLTNPLTAGYASKRHITLLKVAMAISASRGDDKEINEGDVNVAIRALLSTEERLPKVMRAISMSEVGDMTEFLFNTIKQKRMIDRAGLIKAVRHKLSVPQLDDLLLGLVQDGCVVQDARDGKIIYIFKG